jgi:hypothetical protein
LNRSWREAKEDVAALAAGIGAGSAADFALGDLGPGVIFGAVGVERDRRAVEPLEKFGLVGMQSGEQPVEGDEAGSAPEDAVEASAQGGPALRRRFALIGLQV